jgi:hypothetical protein
MLAAEVRFCCERLSVAEIRSDSHFGKPASQNWCVNLCIRFEVILRRSGRHHKKSAVSYYHVKLGYISSMAANLRCCAF